MVTSVLEHFSLWSLWSWTGLLCRILVGGCSRISRVNTVRVRCSVRVRTRFRFRVRTRVRNQWVVFFWLALHRPRSLARGQNALFKPIFQWVPRSTATHLVTVAFTVASTNSSTQPCYWRIIFIPCPAHPGCPGQNPESRKTVVCACACEYFLQFKKKYTNSNETLNFTFTRQAVIVYFDAERWVLMCTGRWWPWHHRCTVCCSKPILRDITVTLLYISPKTPLQSWTWLYCRKANKMSFSTISCPYRNIDNFSHMSQIHFSANIMSFRPFKWMGAQMPKNPRNSPFPLRHVDPHLVHQAHPNHHPNNSSIAECTSAQLFNKVTNGYNGTTQIHPQNCPFPFDDHHSI